MKGTPPILHAKGGDLTTVIFLGLTISPSFMWVFCAAAIPEIPTVAEQGVIVAPAATPLDVVDQLHSALKSIVATPQTQGQIIGLGMIPIDSPPPAALPAFIKSEIVRWSGVVEEAGLTATE